MADAKELVREWQRGWVFEDEPGLQDLADRIEAYARAKVVEELRKLAGEPCSFCAWGYARVELRLGETGHVVGDAKTPVSCAEMTPVWRRIAEMEADNG